VPRCLSFGWNEFGHEFMVSRAAAIAAASSSCTSRLRRIVQLFGMKLLSQPSVEMVVYVKEELRCPIHVRKHLIDCAGTGLRIGDEDDFL